MRAFLGETGTEQFTVETRVDGRVVKTQRIHDPFIRNTTVVGLTRFDHFLAIFKRRQIRVEVAVQGGEGAQRAIMMLDPYELQRESEEILERRKNSREDGVVGLCSASL